MAVPTSSSSHRWLLFVHQLPPHPSNLRVRTWRRLQHLGAVPVRQAVYVLPDTPLTREDFEWLKEEVQSAGGEATVFVANSIDGRSDDAIVEAFRQSGQRAYAALGDDVERLLKQLNARRPRRERRAPAARRMLEVFRERLGAVERTDHFGSVGRDRVVSALRQLEARVTTTAQRASMPAIEHASRFQGRLWVTRPRPGVDRMASAWLIRRFIDGKARFGFAADVGAVPDDAIPFDMFGAEFSHHGAGCTFETLCNVFSLDNVALLRVAAVVHDLDLKDGRFGAAEAATVGAVIEGLQLGHADDEALLAHGMVLFDSLYRSFEQSARAGKPRSAAEDSGTRRAVRRRPPGRSRGHT